MRGARREDTEAPGQDSFLDVVANLVGILIILIMVIGAGAKSALVDAAPDAAAHEVDIDVATPQAAAKELERDVYQLQSKIDRHKLEVAYRQAERDQLLQLVQTADHDLSERRQKLSDADQAEYDLRLKLSQADQQLDELRRTRAALEAAADTPGVIRHLPTPIAKTVFGKEVHFRLLGGNLAYVPLDELVEVMKNEAPQKLWKLKDAPRTTEMIGPMQGFRMKYTLRHADYALDTNSGPMVQRRIELERFELIPEGSRLGQPVEQALQNGSELRTVLAENDRQRTTVTVWVYPDSFRQFRTLKEELYKLGYLAASRPLPDGELIAGGPSGTRSASQ